jgi:uncharacterized protein (DUF924 family)
MYTVTPNDVITFWTQAGPALWFAVDRDFDARLRWTFFGAHQAAARGDLDDWQATPDGALALILLLDQFPRNIFRGLARAFSTDANALSVAHRAIEAGFDAHYEPPLRRFFYLPMMHAEDLAEQDFCIEKCRACGDEEGVKFGLIHRADIARFGRFPYRNAVLGRANTADEAAFLKGESIAG